MGGAVGRAGLGLLLYSNLLGICNLLLYSTRTRVQLQGQVTRTHDTRDTTRNEGPPRADPYRDAIHADRSPRSVQI